MAWVSWDLICLPKIRGGIGVKNLEAFNLALLAKWRWRILAENNECLWKKILTHRYGSVENWNGTFVNGRDWRKSSIWWRDLKVLGVGTRLESGWFNELVRKKLGDGSTIKFWSDVWLGRESFADLFPVLYSRVEHENVSVKEMGEWNDEGWCWCRFRPAATAVTVAADSAATQAAAAELSALLVGVQPVRDSADKWVCLIDNLTGFSVKKCYEWLLNFLADDRGILNDNLKEAYKKLWRNDVPSKVLIFTWRLLMKRIATRDVLARRGILSSPHDLCCVFCFNEIESVSHLFFGCAVSREVWRMVMNWLGVSVRLEEDAVENFVEFGKALKGKKRKRVKHLIWLAVVWCLWKARNNTIFKSEPASVSSIIDAVKMVSWGWFMARSGKKCGVTWADWASCPMGGFLSL